MIVALIPFVHFFSSHFRCCLFLFFFFVFIYFAWNRFQNDRNAKASLWKCMLHSVLLNSNSSEMRSSRIQEFNIFGVVICLFGSHVRWFLLRNIRPFVLRIECANAAADTNKQEIKLFYWYTHTHARARSENKIVDSINKRQRLCCVAKANSKQRERGKNIIHEFLFP